MVGFLIGTACLIGLVAMVRRRRWGHRGGRRGSYVLYRLFERLDTSPGQERALRNVRDELFGQVGELRTELADSRKDVARAIRGATFDEAALSGAFARQDEAIGRLRVAVSGALAKVHDILDDRQREKLADLVETGPGLRGMVGGPYRRCAREGAHA